MLFFEIDLTGEVAGELYIIKEGHYYFKENGFDKNDFLKFCQRHHKNQPKLAMRLHLL